jgi:hypothetical protein
VTVLGATLSPRCLAAKVSNSPEPTIRPGTKRQISSSRVRTDNILAAAKTPAAVNRAGCRASVSVMTCSWHPTILLDLRSDMRRLIRIFRGMNSG